MRSHFHPQRRRQDWHRCSVHCRSFTVILAVTISLCVCRSGALAASATTFFTPTGAAANDWLGWSVGSAGDVNGDGYADVIVGAPQADAAPGLDTGRAYIYFGGPGADAVADVTLTGEAAYNWFGFSAATAGDMNGDGFADVIVGARYADTPEGFEYGRAYIYYGGSAPDNVADLVLTGAAPYNYFGHSVGTAGDVNGDSYADVIVGAPDSGWAYVFYGGPGADAVPDLTLAGLASGDYFGVSVGTAGDLNGDGYADVIVGADHNSAVAYRAGQAYIYYGGASADAVPDLILNGAAAGDFFGGSVATAGDLNGDGYADVIVGALASDAGGAEAGRAYVYYGGVTPDDVPDLTLTGAAPGDGFGGAVAMAGDFNGDGHADVIVGAYGNDAGGQAAGRAYVFFGGPGVDNAADVTLTGSAASDEFGRALAGGGDVNGDGLGDVVIGAPLNSAGGTYAGRAYVTAFSPDLIPPNIFAHDNAWAPNGPVSAIASSGNTIYMGGAFSLLGPVSGPAVAIDYVTAEAQKPFPRVTGKVRAVEPDGSGGWYIGGAFTKVQGQIRNNLAQIDASGNLTSWNPDANGEVDDIAVGGSVVYVGGAFSFVGPAPRSYVAAIDASTGQAVTTWTSLPNGPVTEVEWAGSEIYVGGGFTTVNGAAHEHLAALFATTGTPTSFHSGTGTGITNVDALEFSGGKLFMGVNSNIGYYLRTYDPATGYLPYTVSVNGPIQDIAFDQAGGVAYLGGSFTNVGSHVLAVHVPTGSILTWGVSMDGPVRTIALIPPQGNPIDGVLIGGLFNTVGGQPRQNLAALHPTQSLVLGFSPACGGEVYALEANGGTIYAGGDFSIINGVPRSNLAAVDATAGSPLSWNPTTNGTVEALAVSGNTVYVGGQFSSVNGTTRYRAAGVDVLTGALTAFNPIAIASTATTVKAFAIAGSTIFMGGLYHTIEEDYGVRTVNATTGAAASPSVNTDGPVYAISYVPGGVFGGPILVVGGSFGLIGGQFRTNLATVDATTGIAGGAIDLSTNGPVRSLAVVPLPPGYGGFDRFYVGGDFTTLGGQPRNHIGMVVPLGVATWNPNANGEVDALMVSGNIAFAGGTFTTIAGQMRGHIAAIDVSGLPTPWDPNADGISSPVSVYALLKLAGTVYVGGTFTTIAGTPQAYFAGVSDGTVTGVEEVERDPTPAVTPLALRVAPNPFEQSTMVQFSLSSAGKAHVAVFDVAGRRIRELHNGWLSSGRHALPWDGRDGSGRPVAAGIYFLGVRTPAEQAGSKVYRLK